MHVLNHNSLQAITDRLTELYDNKSTRARVKKGNKDWYNTLKPTTNRNTNTFGVSGGRGAANNRSGRAAPLVIKSVPQRPIQTDYSTLPVTDVGGRGATTDKDQILLAPPPKPTRSTSPLPQTTHSTHPAPMSLAPPPHSTDPSNSAPMSLANILHPPTPVKPNRPASLDLSPTPYISPFSPHKRNSPLTPPSPHTPKKHTPPPVNSESPPLPPPNSETNPFIHNIEDLPPPVTNTPPPLPSSPPPKFVKEIITSTTETKRRERRRSSPPLPPAPDQTTEVTTTETKRRRPRPRKKKDRQRTLSNGFTSISMM